MRFIEGIKGKKETKTRKEKQNEKVSHKREKPHKKATKETLHRGGTRHCIYAKRTRCTREW